MSLRAGGLTGLMNQPSAQVIDGSLKFDDAANTRLKRTVSDGNRRTFTFACWVKRGVINATPINIFAAGSNNFRIALGAGDGYFQVYNYNGSSHDFIKGTASMYRDTGWYHLVVAIDTTNGTPADRMKLYVNGERLADSIFTNGNTNPSENFQSYVNDSSNTHYLGYIGASGYDLDAYLSQAYFIDGQALGPENFGFTDPLTGTWRPKKYKVELAVTQTVNPSYVSNSAVLDPTNAFDGSSGTEATYSGVNSWLSFTVSDASNLTVPFMIRNDSSGTGQTVAMFTDSGGSSAAGGTWGSTGTNNLSPAVSTTVEDTYTFPSTGTYYLRHTVGSDSNIFVYKIGGSVTTGANSFYLPMDGNSPIGQDKSGNGNDWTPVNFSGSNSLDKATGALPILNTTPGGVSASVGVRTDAYANSLALALPLSSDLNAVTNQINSGATNRTILSHNSPSSSTTKSNFYGRSYYLDGSQAITIGVIGTDLQFGSDDFTMEIWFNSNTTLDSSYWNPIVSFPWHGGSNTNSQVWIGFAGGASSPYSAGELHSRIKTASGIVELPSGILTAYNDNAWHHVAVTRNGSTASIYVDGVLRNTASISGSLNTSYGSYEAFIGAYDHGGGGLNAYFKGYVNDFRVYKGTAKYTSNFIPASTDPDILPDTPSGVSGGSKLAKITDGAVGFEGTATSKLTLADSSDFTFGTNDFCIEFYYYNNSLDGTYNIIFDCMGSNRSGIQLAFETDGDYRIEVGDGSSNWIWQSTGFDAKAKKWTHFALTRQGSTFRAFEDGVLLGTQTSSTAVGDPRSPAIGGYASDNSSNYGFNGFISNFRIVNGSAVYTAAFTPPTAPLTNVTNTKLLCCQSTVEPGGAAVAPNVSGINNGTQWSNYLTGAGGFQGSYPATKAFNGTASASETSRSTNAGETQTFAPPSGIPYSSKVEVWTWYQGNVSLNGGSNVAVSDDQDWRTIATGSGTLNSLAFIGNSGNNIYLAGIRIDSTTILVDPVSPNGDAAATNFNPFNTDINTVRGQETGYATMNPLDNEGFTLSDGNLNVSNMGSSRQVHANIFVNSGKWYAEFTCKAAMNDTLFGVANVDGTSFLGSDTNSWGVISINGNRIHDQNGSGGQSSYGSSFTTGDVISVALDMDNGKWYAAKNGVYFGGGNPLTGANPAYSGLTGDLTFAVGSNSTGGDVSCNFGQKPFKFPPPDGFQPLNSVNVRPETVISRPDQYVGTILYTGTGNTSGREISGLNFNAKPDLIWIKNRGEAIDHILFDSLRGFGANKELTPNDAYSEGQTGTGAPNTQSWGFVKSNNLNGFTVQSGSSGQSVVNNNSINYVAWCWKAGGDTYTYNKDYTGGSSASDIGISATTLTLTGASINTKSKFGMYTYTGSGSGSATITHGLGGTPAFVVYKKRTGSSSWQIYHQSLGGTKYMNWDEDTNAYTSDSTRFGGTDPTSSTISLGTHANGAGGVVLYAWCDVPGLQKFGSYTGNSSANGVYVELGFRPAIVIIKNTTDDSKYWYTYDTSRNTYNPINTVLAVNRTDSTITTGNLVDIVSNGFKLRSDLSFTNVSGKTYIYMAWAEAPASNLFGAQSNAR